MADDMGICPYANEAAESYGYRVIYSALGLWCLKSALSEKENIKGISKSAQSHLEGVKFSVSMGKILL